MIPDLRFALRTIGKNRAFAAAAALTLSLGIGANSAMFTVIRAVLLKPLAYPEPDRVVKIAGGETIAHFELIKAGQQSYSSVGAYFCCASTVSLSGPEGPVPLKAEPVSANFLEILGIQPVVGRGFLPEEDSPGGPRVAMISAALWQNRFQGDPHIAGKSVTVSAVPYTIVGVVPSGFDFPFADIDVWVTRPQLYANANSPLLQPFARLKPGVTMAQASAELAVLNTQYRSAHPGMLDAKPPTSPERVAPLKDALVDNVRSTLWMLSGAVGLVLLIACANVAGLLLARATSRSREFAVRTALGAPRSRVIRQLLMESVLLATIGGALGLLLAFWGVRALAGISSLDLPRMGEIHLDGMVFAFAAVLSIATGLLFGLLPALHASRPDLASVLRASGEAASPGHRRVVLGLSARGVLVVAQVGLSMILLIGAALLIESMVRLGRVQPGFNPHNVLTMRINLPFTRYDTDAKQMAFFNQLTERVESLPGVRSAALTFTAPLTTYALTPIRPVDQGVVPLNQRLIAMFQNITPDYFRTLEIPLRRGREFTQRDDAHAPLAVILNEALARKLWPAYPNGPDPIGQWVWIGAKMDPVEVAGIVADTHQYLGVDLTPAMYRPLAQSTSAGAFLVRTEGDPLRFANAVRAQILAIDRDQAVTEVKSLEDLFAADAGHNRPILSLLSGFAGVALMLALTGLYGVIAYSVAQRTQELGIRRALGAQHADILSLVLRQGFGLTIAGIALGVGGGLALTRFLKSLLFEVSPADPGTFVGVAILFLAVALAAAYVPARRATRIDPMQALR
jgi:putative ABC transport system permease protein